jgi:hypothetical protein
MIRPTCTDRRVKKSQAAEDLFMQYRIERAARGVGWASLFIFGLFLVVSAVGVFKQGSASYIVPNWRHDMKNIK